MSDYVPSNFSEVTKPRRHGFSRLHIRALIGAWKQKGRTQRELADACTVQNETRSDKAVSDWKSMTSFPSRESFELLTKVIFQEFIEDKETLEDDDHQRLKAFADDLLENSSDREILRFLPHVSRRPITERFRQYLDDSEKRLIDPLQKFMPRGISNAEWAAVYEPPPMRLSTTFKKVTLSEVFAGSNREFISIIADGGKGKSTLLRYLRYAAWHQPTTIGLEGSHFPVLILAQAFEAVDRSFSSEQPMQYLIEAFKRSHPPGSWTASNNMIENVLRDHAIPCLILIDGFTQVTSKFQTRIAETLYPLFKQFESEDSRTGIIVAGRNEMSQHFGDIGSKYTLLPLQQDYFDRLVVLWAGKGSMKFHDMLDEPKRASIARLIRHNPLFQALALTYFCDNGETLPTNMVDFFENFFCKAAGSFGDDSSASWEIRKHTNSVLGHVAYQQLSERAELMTEPFIRDTAKNYFRQRPECCSDSLMAITFAEAFCDLVAGNKTALFQTIAQDNELDNLPVCYEWIHDLLRDYLASCVLHDQPERLADLVKENPKGDAEDWTIPCAFALLMMDSETVDPLIGSLMDTRFGLFIVLQYLGFGGQTDNTLQDRVAERVGEEISQEKNVFSRCGTAFQPFVVSSVEFAVHVEAIRSKILRILESPDLKPETRETLEKHLEEKSGQLFSG